jgi:hypothetical protein
MNMRKMNFGILGILTLFFAFVACKDDFTEEDFLRLQAELEAQKDSVAAAIALDSLDAQRLRDSIELVLALDERDYQRFLDSLRRADSIQAAGGGVLPFTFTVQIIDGSITATTAINSGTEVNNDSGERTDAVNESPANPVTVSVTQFGQTRELTVDNGVASFDNIGRGAIFGKITAQDYTTIEFVMDASLNQEDLAEFLTDPLFFYEYVYNMSIGHTFAMFATAGQNTATLTGSALVETDLTNTTPELVPEGTNFLAYIDVLDGDFQGRYVDALNPSWFLNTLQFGYSPVQYAAVDATGTYSFTLPAAPQGLPFILEFSDFIANRTYFSTIDGEVTEITKSFAYGPTQVATAIPVITAAPVVSFRAGGGAAAVAVINSSGEVIDIDLVNNGQDFQGVPRVIISAPAAGGTQATATATVTNGEVTAITITNAGSGYLAAPSVTITEGNGAVASVTNLDGVTGDDGTIVAVTVQQSGVYLATPNVVFFTDAGPVGLDTSDVIYDIPNTVSLSANGGINNVTVTADNSNILWAGPAGPQVVATNGTNGSIYVEDADGDGTLDSIAVNTAGFYYTDITDGYFTVSSIAGQIGGAYAVNGEFDGNDEVNITFTITNGRLTGVSLVDSTYAGGAGNFIGSLILNVFSQDDDPGIVGGQNAVLTSVSNGRHVGNVLISNVGTQQLDNRYYSNAPQIIFSAPQYTGPGSVVATGTAVLDAEGRLVGINVTNEGSGYYTAPTISIVSGSGAAATAVLAPVELSEIDVTASGNGYLAAPQVLIVDPNGNGTGATAVANLNNGQITSITLTNPGSGYSSANVIILDPGTRYDQATQTRVANVATGEVEIENGSIVSITMLETGSNYPANPEVVLTSTTEGGIQGSGFAGTAIVTNGSITSVTVNNGGTGYVQGNTPGTAFNAPSQGTFNALPGITRIVDWNYGTGRNRNID